MKRFTQSLSVILVVALLLVIWEQAVRIFEIKRYLLPAPSAVLRAMVESREYLIPHALATVQVVVIGFALSFLLALAVAVAMLFWPGFARVMQPLLVFLKTLPTMVTAPMLVIWIGWSLKTILIAVVLNAALPIVISLYDGFRAPDSEQVEMFQAAGATRWQVFVKLRLPASLPVLFPGLKTAAVAAVTGSAVGEIIVGQMGLGHYAKAMVGQLETADVFAAVMLISLLGVFSYLAITGLERVVMPWYFMDKDKV